ncbi:DEAD/DEAH box helicase [Streptomyces sp. ID05-04B]|uniref:DEAD/DEAH box helicase n=1 Tax=Streptomyces sp. ID05-04B TaxID=3028661 RepID=UPI0029C2E235|nr:DEAD/DEAH box helicase [Streptomyces sp. ID05-04B]MDX5563174.1 DEAD/DEAH box helicase [Streptomyces sp. ID05-04B]
MAVQRELADYGTAFWPSDPPRGATVSFWRPHSSMGRPEDLKVPHTALLQEQVPVIRMRGSLCRGSVRGWTLPVLDALPVLVSARRRERGHESTVFWGAAAMFALDLVARGRLLPGLSPGGYDAWVAGPLSAEDEAVLQALVQAMPATAHTPAPAASGLGLLEPAHTVRSFLDAVADAMVRSPLSAPLVPGPYTDTAVHHVPHLAVWTRDVAAAREGRTPLSLRVDLDWPSDGNDIDPGPAVGGCDLEGGDGLDEFGLAGVPVVLQVHDPDDPTVVRDADQLWRSAPPSVPWGRGVEAARAEVREVLERGARAWPPLRRLARGRVPDKLLCDAEELRALMGDAVPLLADAGIAVHWPKAVISELTSRAALAPRPRPSTARGPLLSLGQLLSFRYQLCLGGKDLSEQDMDQLARAQRPLVRLRDQWVLLDASMLRRLRRRELGPLTGDEALAAALTGSVDLDGHDVPVTVHGWLADAHSLLTAPHPGPDDVIVPAALKATLRPYQRTGLAWLEQLTSAGIGACLADDMGLGKTITLIALHLRRQEQPHLAGPTLVVAPATLLGTWAGEAAKFAPDTPVRRYHGPGRSLELLQRDAIVVTTYATLRQDRELLAAVGWSLMAADEAQHMKNPYSSTTKALSAIGARARVALTGTPVENNLSELWSILDWAVPGLFGPLKRFRSRYGRPIESGSDPRAAERLAAVVRPFLLRRRKSDPGVAPELPPKTVSDHTVALTREQAGLYEAVVRETLDKISDSKGVKRRSLILSLLTALKQICNHPAHYGKEDPGSARLPGRSGKLALLDDLLDVILTEEQSVLVFSQYAAMARLLQHHLARRGVPALFLHGATPVHQRDAMVTDFQSGDVPVFLLSLKAAGTGLTLTRAEHVIHFDRWWNPAVEDQASDRAHRIGQTRPVQIHRLTAEGTLEESIHTMLHAKRALAETVLAHGPAALTELSDTELADLVKLR